MEQKKLPDHSVAGNADEAHDHAQPTPATDALTGGCRHARQCLDMAGAIIVTLDLDRRIGMVNRRGCEMLGYPETQLLGRNWFDLFADDAEREAIEQIFRKPLTGSLQHENTLLTRSGEARTIIWDYTPIRDPSGTPIGALASGEDVTEYRRVIAELAASEDRLHILFEYAPDACYLINDQGRFADGNRAAEAIVGYERGELIGKTLPESGLLADRELPRAMELMEHGFHQPIGPAELQLTRRDGSSVPIEVSTYPVNIQGSRFILAIARDISERKDNQQRLLQVFRETIEIISRTIETRDPYTAGHQQRVAQLASAIGREMGLEPQILEGLHFGALIHDIGKIYVPAELLNRPGRLSAAEFELIKTHCEVGFSIVEDVAFPWPVAQMILQHHERMDGSGYPGGIRGERMLLEARILAVADVMEAMSAHRPYRPSLGMRTALAEIETGKGTRYDSLVADACLTLFHEQRFRFEDDRPD